MGPWTVKQLKKFAEEMKSKKTSKPRNLHVEGRDTSSIFYLYLCLQHEDSLVSTSFCFSFPQQASSAVLQSKERQFKSPNFRVKKNYEFVAFLILIVFHENPAIKRQYLVCFSPMLKGGIVNRLRRN